MLKLVTALICFSFSIVNADVKFDEIIKNNISDENTLATEVQQYAGVESEPKKKSVADYTGQAKRDSDFKVVLRKKNQMKNPVIQREIASKSIRVIKKSKKKKKLASVSSVN